MGYLDDRLGLQDKVALIAGGGGGLGRAVADDFAQAGMHLVLLDKNEELLTRSVADIGAAAGEEPLAALIDVRDADAVSRAFDDALARFGKLDVLVNVAGGTFKADFVDTNVRGWDAVIRANFGWLLHTTHLAANQMRKQGHGGSIISITSIEGHRAAPGYAVYAGMKGAVTNFSRTLALELAPDRIRVNTIAPDQVPTEGMPMEYDERGSSPPASRWDARAPTSDIGGAALFLASNLSEYITGTTLHPDGGAWASAGWWNWPELGYVNNPPLTGLDQYS